MEKEIVLSVAAIENGTVIDHIPAGQGMRIVRLLKLADHKKKVTLGLNLPSRSLGYKDLIKVEGREVSEEEASQIALFAPKGTINIIRGYQIGKKFSVTLPEMVSKILACPNQKCITNHEQLPTNFRVSRFGQKVMLQCHYCERGFAHDHY
jgi:aspartate carbamoyltransferase regulatory subunit